MELIDKSEVRKGSKSIAKLFYSRQVVKRLKTFSIEKNSFAEVLKSNKVYFFGSGAQKCKPVLQHPDAVFVDDVHSSATGMISLSEKKFAEKQFEDVAYFEPFYLKDFVAIKPREN